MNFYKGVMDKIFSNNSKNKRRGEEQIDWRAELFYKQLFATNKRRRTNKI